MAARPRAEPIRIGGEEVPAGRRIRLDVPVARLPTGTWLSLPLDVVHGRRPGKRLWLSAALHGDELNGIEIIRRTLRSIDPRVLCGTVVAAPIVNVFGFLERSRYLPDRRDLNRSFPGSPKGSMASRLAHLFTEEVVRRSDVGIDLHTGSDMRTNLPQIRADLDDDETCLLAEAFAAPVMIHSRAVRGSLRKAAADAGIPNLLFEGGEANRFDKSAILAGVQGVLRVLELLDMRERSDPTPARPSRVSRRTCWVRAGRGGILRLETALGDLVRAGDVLGAIYEPVGDKRRLLVRARTGGMLVGMTQDPVVNRGDAIVHIAELEPEDPDVSDGSG